MASETSPYDAVLLHSFGGPEAADEVMPFLRRVTAGRGVPEERLASVAEHYYALGGKSPINAHTRALADALQSELARAGRPLPVHVANRFAPPYFDYVVRALADGGARRLVAVTTSAFSGHSSCRAYVDAHVAAPIPVDKVRSHWNHPGVVRTLTELLAATCVKLPSEARPKLLFTAHSVPLSAARTSNYEAELRELARLLSGAVAFDTALVFQSRSGSPEVPWLEPDVVDAIESAAREGITHVVVQPIGFTSDHVEVVWDLDRVARTRAEELGMAFLRVPTPGVSPRYVAALVDLVLERVDGRTERPVAGDLPPCPDACSPSCCPLGRPGRTA